MGETYLSKVAELRKKKELTQRKLADLIGVDPSTIRNWERDRGGVDMFVKLAKLCKALDCNIDDLFETVDITEEEGDRNE